MSTAPKPMSKTEVAETLRRRILAMELKPSQLLDEVALANAFGISRTPMREVIQRLAGEGYLEIEANRGAKVAPMDLATMRHFFQAAPMIYSAAARLAAENATPAQLDELRAIQARIRDAVERGDSPAAAIHNHAFHAFVGEMAQSPYLLPSLGRLLIDHTRLSQRFYKPADAAETDSIRTAVDQHDAMITAFAAHDAAAAVALTVEHWNLSRHRIEQFVTPDPLPFELEDLSHAV
ncbi:MAG: GntR family transcriptional regulator [Rhodospirillales bacterium]